MELAELLKNTGPEWHSNTAQAQQWNYIQGTTASKRDFTGNCNGTNTLYFSHRTEAVPDYWLGTRLPKMMYVHCLFTQHAVYHLS